MYQKEYPIAGVLSLCGLREDAEPKGAFVKDIGATLRHGTLLAVLLCRQSGTFRCKTPC